MIHPHLPTTILLSTACVATCVSALAQDGGQAVERLRTDSRAPYVHRITLYDHDGEAIDPGDPAAPPYSPPMTCGKCHPVAQIAHGWHFDADEADVDPGRPGEPWIYSDPATGTQLPLSARGWQGTFTPAELELSNWEFVKRFGRHTPGGGLGDPDQTTIDDSGESLRWNISGTLQIDCMFCHSADQRHDPAEAKRQIEKENFRWSPTAALGLGVIRGQARLLPDDFDPLAPPNPDFPERAGPKVEYDASRFDADDRVFFNVTRRVPIERCYFCHSFRLVDSPTPERWRSDGDVHVAAGMICVDCHRNGLDHMITRGYATDDADADASAAALTCRGCHLGQAALVDGPGAKAGRLGAPYPEHNGLPLVHFEKLTCTACHSGPWPRMNTRRFQTAMNHGLGVPTRTRSDDDAPTILGPIFARPNRNSQPDRKIAPYRMVWPAFWGVLASDGTIRPLPFEHLRGAVNKLAGRAKAKHPAETAPLADEDIIILLTRLSSQAEPGESIVYVRNGRVRYLSGDGKLISHVHAAGQPYMWPIAHDVRPAGQSLGIRGCRDCHAGDAPIYFGNTVAADERGADDRPMRKMYEFRDEANPTLARVWGLSFRVRTAFKWFGFICAGIIAIVLLRPPGSARRAGSKTVDKTILFVTLLGVLITALTGFGGSLIFNHMSDRALLAHMAAAPLVMLGFAAMALAWGGRHRLERTDAGGGQPRESGIKLLFWLTLMCGLASSLSMLAAMLPVFGYIGQDRLRVVHEVSGIGLLAAGGLYMVCRYVSNRSGRVKQHA